MTSGVASRGTVSPGASGWGAGPADDDDDAEPEYRHVFLVAVVPRGRRLFRAASHRSHWKGKVPWGNNDFSCPAGHHTWGIVDLFEYLKAHNIVVTAPPTPRVDVVSDQNTGSSCSVETFSLFSVKVETDGTPPVLQREQAFPGTGRRAEDPRDWAPASSCCRSRYASSNSVGPLGSTLSRANRRISALSGCHSKPA